MASRPPEKHELHILVMLDPGAPRADALPAAVALGVARDAHHVGVPRHDPQVVGLVAVHRGLGPEPPVGGPRVVVEGRVAEVEGRLGFHERHPSSVNVR